MRPEVQLFSSLPPAVSRIYFEANAYARDLAYSCIRCVRSCMLIYTPVYSVIVLLFLVVLNKAT